MKTVLLLDTGFSSLPIYNYLMREGYHVHVMGNRAGDALAQMAGPNWIDQDYSQIDRVQQIMDQKQFDFVVPGCTDLSIEVCQKALSSCTRFDSPHINQHLADKEFFRRLCTQLKIPTPQKTPKESFPLGGMFICKPVDAYSGRGISIIDGLDMAKVHAADKRAQSASPTNRSLFETFVSGQLYSYSAFLTQKMVEEYFIVREGSSANPFAVDTSYVEEDFDIAIENEIRTAIEKIAHHLQLVDGLIHLQFIVSDGCPYFIEVTRRCPGDLYAKLIEYSTGFDYAGKFASYFVGETYNTLSTINAPIIRHTMTSNAQVHFEMVQFKHDLKIKAFYPLLGLGEPIAPQQKTRVGILFSWAMDKNECYQQYMNQDVYAVAHSNGDMATVGSTQQK
ncbi:MAG: ATP-grasp domain-containing protein [Myxococcota bacterium]|nr:ATP-grasp domain-containing protein [Myxococcota bacterium]